MNNELRLHIRHHTGFIYEGFAKSSYNEARMTPLSLPTQEVESTKLTVRPAEPLFTYRDYFGTQVTAFDIGEVHGQLEVESTSTIRSRPASVEGDLTWSDLTSVSFIDRMNEYLLPTRRSSLPAAVLAEIATLRGTADLHQVVDAVSDFVRSRVQYVPGATTVTSTAVEALERGKGVCQDITHITLGLLRSLGIPARYVSGYLYPKRDPQIGETIQGQSHAWVEYYAGAWTGIDPTNGVRHTARHILVGRGRDYGDVSPLKGIYHGPKSKGAGVVVDITRLA
jgi:transglutaminase-like putative cysteine protease